MHSSSPIKVLRMSVSFHSLQCEGTEITSAQALGSLEVTPPTAWKVVSDLQSLIRTAEVMWKTSHDDSSHS